MSRYSNSTHAWVRVQAATGRHVSKMRLHFLGTDDRRGRYQTRGVSSLRLAREIAMAISEMKQLFSASLAKDAVYKSGLRSFMEYRDLGIEKATHGQFRAHVIRI